MPTIHGLWISDDVAAENPHLFPPPRTHKLGGVEAEQANLASAAEAQFLAMWQIYHGPPIQAAYTFDAQRKWQFDFAHEPSRLAIEIDGVHGRGGRPGRHRQTKGFENDARKQAEAILAGWIVLRLTPSMIQPALIERLIQYTQRRQP